MRLLVFLWFSFGFALVFLWFFLWFSFGFLWFPVGLVGVVETLFGVASFRFP